jgi:hypothetical protein
MKCVGKIAIWLASGLVLIAGARADDAAVASADNPYAPIVARNLFNLNPVTADAPVGDPPPKITLNGIMSISGHLQVLFKVAGGATPGQQAKDQSYILSEGQRQDDVEVTHINDKASLVTFNNHGTVQEIPLASTPGSTPPGTGPGRQPARPNYPSPTGGGYSGYNGSSGGMVGNTSVSGGGSGPSRGMGNNAFQNPNSPMPVGGSGGLNVSSLEAAATHTGTYNQQQPVNTMDPAMQAILIAAQHAQLQQEGNPMAAIFPPTPIDTEAGVIPSEPPAGQPPVPPPAPGGGRVR